MRLFGLTITREKALTSPASPPSSGGGGWWPLVRESFPGAWQRNVVVERNAVLSFHAVYACTTLIASDIAKLRVRLMQQGPGDVWIETSNPAYSPVLRKPNENQNRIQFWESWILSKLIHGNAYVLKRRDNRNVVVALYVLDPTRVRPLVADTGSVFYEVQPDNLSGLTETLYVPAREMIHDRWNCLFHPLVGVSAIFASGLAATQGLRIQESSARFFTNDSNPGGILTAPGAINAETAERLKAHWEENYSGANKGRVAVLGDGLKYERMSIAPTDAQLIEQLKWTADVVCSAFHVPGYKVGVGAMPAYNNIQALNVQYYSQCLQVLIEAAELCLDEGLEMAPGIGTEFDLRGLLRMDAQTQIASLKEAVSAGIQSPNEARAELDLRPVPGGDTPYLQQQNYSLSALAKRDAGDDPFGTKPSAPDTRALPAPAQDAAEEASAGKAAAEARAALAAIRKGLNADV